MFTIEFNVSLIVILKANNTCILYRRESGVSVSRNNSNVTRSITQQHLLRPPCISTFAPEPPQNTSENEAITNNNKNWLLGSTEEDTKITAADPDISQEIVQK